MVSANLTYRNHVPFGYIAMECSSLYFNGGESVVRVLDHLRYLIEFERHDEHELRIEYLEKYKQANYTEWLEWQKEIKDFKKRHLFWMLSRELREEMSILQEECERLGGMDCNLSLAISQLKDGRFYEASELTRKFKKLLGELGFTLKGKTRTDGGLCDEIYESTCSDEELWLKAKNITTMLKEEKAKRHAELVKSYSQPDIIESKDIFYM